MVVHFRDDNFPNVSTDTLRTHIEKEAGRTVDIVGNALECTYRGAKFKVSVQDGELTASVTVPFFVSPRIVRDIKAQGLALIERLKAACTQHKGGTDA